MAKRTKKAQECRRRWQFSMKQAGMPAEKVTKVREGDKGRGEEPDQRGVQKDEWEEWGGRGSRELMGARLAPLPSAHCEPALGVLPEPGVLAAVALHTSLRPLVPVSSSAPRQPPSPTWPSEPSSGTRSQLWDKHTHTHVHTRPHMRSVPTHHTPPSLCSLGPLTPASLP